LTNFGCVSQSRSFEPGALIRIGGEPLFSRVYGAVYDRVSTRLPAYKSLHREVLDLIEATRPAGVAAGAVRILELACGPGALTLTLARAGFSVFGVEPFGTLVARARRTQERDGVTNATFAQVPLTPAGTFARGEFDYVVNVHSLYAHPAPMALIDLAYSASRPGGHGIFVNFSRPLPFWSSVGRLLRREGVRETRECLPWLFSNAVFEAARTHAVRNYWSPDDFAARLRTAGFTIAQARTTFLQGASALVCAVRPAATT
jgi:SAM-dependent methyltransferase